MPVIKRTDGILISPNSHNSLLCAIFAGCSIFISMMPITGSLAWLYCLLGLYAWTELALMPDTKPHHLIVFYMIKWLAMYWLWNPLYNLVGLSFTISVVAILFLFLAISLLSSFIQYTAMFTMKSVNRMFFCFVVLPLCWIATESAVLHVLHLPWLGILTTQMDAPYQSLFYNLGHFWSIFFIFAIVSSIRMFIYRHISYIAPLLILTAATCINISSIDREPSTSIAVTLIQANIDKIEQENETRAHINDKIRTKQYQEENLKRYIQLSQNAHQSDLVIWPESVLGNYGLNIQDKELDQIKTLLKYHKNVIFGATLHHTIPHNTSVLLSDKIQHVEKRHYVPLAEEAYPFWLSRWMRSFHLPVSRYEFPVKTETPTMTIYKDGIKFTLGVLICYDAAYSIYEPIDKAIDFYVIQSESVWFSSYVAQHQQLSIARTLASLSHKPVLHVANAGNLAFIDKHGSIFNSTNTAKNTTLTSNIEIP